MSKPIVRRVRPEDPLPTQSMALAGMPWVVQRDENEHPGRVFISQPVAYKWAIQDLARRNRNAGTDH